MRMLYTVGYPELSTEDQSFIAELRREYDSPRRDIIGAHFSLVFGVRDLADADYTAHVRSVAAQAQAVRFTCRYAMLGADDTGDMAHVFLVPDEGYSTLSLLHDRLYTGKLEPFHRLDIPFVPHITVATTKDRRHAKSLCTQLNRTGLCISGALRSLSIGSLEEGRFRTLVTMPLGAT